MAISRMHESSSSSQVAEYSLSVVGSAQTVFGGMYMSRRRPLIDFDQLLEESGDILYLLVSPLITLSQIILGIFTKRHYRVSYSPNANVAARTTDRFRAYHDRAALREAKRLAGPHEFKLERVHRVRRGWF